MPKIVGCPLRREGCLAQREEEILGVELACVDVSLTFRGPCTGSAQIACARHLATAHGRSLQEALLTATSLKVEEDEVASTDSGDDSCRRIRPSAAAASSASGAQEARSSSSTVGQASRPTSAAAASSTGRGVQVPPQQQPGGIDFEEQQESLDRSWDKVPVTPPGADDDCVPSPVSEVAFCGDKEVTPPGADDDCSEVSEGAFCGDLIWCRRCRSALSGCRSPARTPLGVRLAQAQQEPPVPVRARSRSRTPPVPVRARSLSTGAGRTSFGAASSSDNEACEHARADAN